MQSSTLSPLLGAVALLCWDKMMQKYEFTYARFMDDLIVLTKTRAKLRKAIRLTYTAIKPWGYKLHTNEKTYIGKIAKGFDFCGFRLFYDKILLARSCLEKFEKRLSMLYEQLLINRNCIYKNKFIKTISMKSIEQYVLRYKCWAKSIKKQIININDHLNTYL